MYLWNPNPAFSNGTPNQVSDNPRPIIYELHPQMTTDRFIHFNALKHHAGFIREQLARALSESELKDLLLKIGQSQMDLYTGRLSLDQLEEETMDYLRKKNAFYSDDFRRFLGAAAFQAYQLSDGSDWILRYGFENPLQYVHIHPGRYSAHTVRVKSGALKTAIALLWKMKTEPHTAPLSTEAVNRLRQDLAGLSPVADRSEMTHAEALVKLLQQV